jgi:hypothetical protein
VVGQASQGVVGQRLGYEDGQGLERERVGLMFDFPSSPTAGQEFTPPGGPTYVWQSPRWIAKSGATAETFNRIVNPAMQISQQNGTTAGTTNFYYAADQWLSVFTTTGALAFFKYTSFTSPYGSTNRIILQVGAIDTSIASGEYVTVAQGVEGIRVADFGWGTASAKQVVLRFGVRSTMAGTFGGSIRNTANTYAYPFSYTISAGEVSVDKYVTIVIPGATAGAWPTDTGKSFDLFFALACGTGSTSPAGAWASGSGGFALAPTGITNGMATVNTQLHIFDVGLYRDPLNTGVAPPWVMPDYAQELAACKRYWQSMFVMWSGYATSGTVSHAPWTYATIMRTTPAMSGVDGGSAGFPAGVGTLTQWGSGGWEARTANNTGPGYYYLSDIGASARM